jgi:hypothetical protein
MRVIASTKLVMKLKLVSLESGSSPLSNEQHQSKLLHFNRMTMRFKVVLQ